MCGRYVRRSDEQRLADHFHANPIPPDFPMQAAGFIQPIPAGVEWPGIRLKESSGTVER